MRIEKIKAYEILDSRGRPTVEAQIKLNELNSWVSAAVPSGASTGAHEACELRDQDQKKFMGWGVQKACSHIENEIAQQLVGRSFSSQRDWDASLISLDGTANKSRLGANAILACSLAFARAAAAYANTDLFRSLAGERAEYIMPTPMMNVINGGAHADNGLNVQEFMIIPDVGNSFHSSLQAGCEIFMALKKLLHKKNLATSVGDEGGFAPRLENHEAALDLLVEATEAAGYRPGQDVFLGLDVAATELLNNEQYVWGRERLTSDQLIEIYSNWIRKYPIVSIEDGMAEDDWLGWQKLTRELGSKVQLVGDDVFVTQSERLRTGLAKNVANAILIKVNQVGTVSETLDSIELAQKNNYACVMSHRSGETEDTAIADLAVGWSCGQIKTGSLCRGERTAKYNQLLRIEKDLGQQAKYLGLKSLAMEPKA